MATRKGLPKPVAKYEGKLAEPVYLSWRRSLLDLTLADLGKTEDQRIDELADRFSAAQNARIGLLFHHYKIDPVSEDAWRRLAWKLATDHVPGMKFVVGEKPSRGRKKSWQNGLRDELVREVEAEQKSAVSLISFTEAIKRLQKKNKQKWGGYTFANLVTRHREARRRDKLIRPIVEALLRQPSMEAPSVDLQMGGLYGMGPPAPDEK